MKLTELQKVNKLIADNKKILEKRFMADNPIHTAKELAEITVNYAQQEIENLKTPDVINCPICGGETHQVCYKCTKDLCSHLKLD